MTPPAGSATAPSPAPASRSVAEYLLELAKDRFNRGVLEKDTEQLERAFDALELGHALSSDPALGFNAARVARELGRCAEARVLYEEFLAREADPERRARAQRHLAELGPCDPGELTEAASVLPGRSAEVLSVAPWRFSARDPVRWEELASTASATEPPSYRPWFWAAAGAAGVSVILSGVFLVQAGSKDAELERFEPDPADPDAAAEQVEALQSEGQAAQTRARVFGAIAAGLGVTAAVGLWLTAPASEGSSDDLVLQASSDGAQALWHRRF